MTTRMTKLFRSISIVTLLYPAQLFAASVTLEWAEVEFSDHYKLMQKGPQDGDFQRIYGGNKEIFTAENIEPGSYSYKVVACVVEPQTQQELCEEVADFSEEVVVEVEDNLSAEWANFAQVPVEDTQFNDVIVPTSNYAGMVAGTASVSGGKALYEVPIVLPPGRNNMAPNIALQYSSNSGNDIAGVGWSLSGIGAITRCAATVAQDGRAEKVQLLNTDKLCLNGERLMLTEGGHGEAGAVYRTEIDSFARVTLIKDLDEDDSHFKVEMKDGMTAYYGGHSSSRQIPENQSATFSWHLSKQLDSTGNNVIDYHYTGGDSGEIRIQHIYYTGDVDGPGDRSVSFVYETRPIGDQGIAYVSGGALHSSKRLESIQTFYKSRILRSYELNYQSSDATLRSLLQSIEETAFLDAADEAGEKRHISVKTHHSEPDWTAPINDVSPVIAGVGQLDLGANDRILNKDLNGDGISELLHLARTDTDNTTPPVVHLYELQTDGTYILEKTLSGDNTHHIYAGVEGDINQDGVTDFVFNNNGHFAYLYFDADFNLTQINTDVALTEHFDSLEISQGAQILDIDNDGYQDVVLTRAGDNGAFRTAYYRNKGTGDVDFHDADEMLELRHRDPRINESASLRDMNGDGLTDLVLSYKAEDNTLQVSIAFAEVLSDGTLSFVREGASKLGLPEDLSYTQFTWADLNGDSLADFVRAVEISEGAYQWVAQINQGNKSFDEQVNLGTALGIHKTLFNGEVLPVSKVQAYNSGLQVADIDNDGRDELLIASHSSDSLCAKVTGRPKSANGELGDPIEVIRCDDDLHQLEHPNTGEGPNIIAGNLGIYDLRRYSWSALDFSVAGGVPALQRTLENVVQAPLASTLFLDGRTVSALRSTDFNNDGYLDFEYRLLNGFVSTQDFTLGGTEYKLGGVRVDFDADNPEIASGYYLQANQSAHSQKLQDNVYEIKNGDITSQWHYAQLSRAELINDARVYEVPTERENFYTQTDPNGEHFYFTSSMYVVNSFFQSNGVGGSNEQRYRYGEAVYNTKGRGFQGFRTIEVEDVANQNKVKSQFHQIFPYTGRLESQTQEAKTSDGVWHKVNQTLVTWDINSAHGAEHSNNLYHLYAAKSEIKHYDLELGEDAEMSTRTTEITAIDEYGNVESQTVKLKDNIGTHETQTENAWTSEAGDWWLNRLDSVTTTHKIPVRDAESVQKTQAEALDTQRVLTVSYSEYDALTRQAKTITTESDDAHLRKYDEDVIGNDTVGKHTLVVNTVFNEYGLPTSVSQEASVFNGAGNSWSSATRSTHFTYSDDGTLSATDGYFPYQISNAKSHVTTTETDVATGQPLRVEDANGVVTDYQYDRFGRLTSTEITGSPKQYVAYQNVSDEAIAPDLASWKLVTRQAGAPEQIQYFDSLQRSIRSAKQDFDGTSFYLTDIDYNARGLVAFESMPYLSGNNRYGVQYLDYDSLGRLTEKHTDQATGSDLQTRYTYDQFTTVIEASDLTMSRTYDASQQLIQTVDAMGGETEYAYDNMGNPLVIQDANGVAITAQYNGLGHKLYVDDPNMGLTAFINNGFGEVEHELDANGDAIDYQYDALGRVTSRTTKHDTDDTLDTAAVFAWDDECKKGLLCQEESKNASNVKVMERVYAYDDALRLESTKTTLDGNEYTIQTLYDEGYGRPKALIYPNGLIIEYGYNAQGYLTTEFNAASKYEYRKVTAMDAFGNILDAEITNGKVEIARTFAGETGQMLSAHSIKSNGVFALQNLEYSQYDEFGNLETEHNHVLDVVESYSYDKLHRLISNTLTYAKDDLATTSYGYDAVGNFLFKSDYSENSSGAYQYGNLAKTLGGKAGPNAVRSVKKSADETVSFGYDNKGNLISGDGLTSEYYAYAKPYKITRNSVTSKFWYGSDRMRYKQTTGDKTTYYIDKLYEVEGDNERLYISDVAVIKTTAADPASGTLADVNIRFLHRDRLGSAQVLTNQAGNVTEERRFDPFGKPRSASIVNLESPTLAAFGGDVDITDRGFTDHEHLDDQELIHMNGRVYDYNLGRFMSVDPVIQSPGNSQSINPYSYIMNNPLAGTDPTGYCSAATGSKLKSCGDLVVSGVAVTEKGSTYVGTTVVENVNFHNGNEIQEALNTGASRISSAIENIGSQTLQASSSGQLAGSNSQSGVGQGIIDKVGNAVVDSLKNGGRLGLGLAMAMVTVNQTEHEDGTPVGELPQDLLDEMVPSDTIDYNEIEGIRTPTPPRGPDDDDNDNYENPGHHDPSGRGPNPYNNTKSVLPSNHQELWKASRRASDGNRWTKVGQGKKAVYHRFQNDGNGNWHWNGSTNGVTKAGRSRAIRNNHVPKDVKRW